MPERCNVTVWQIDIRTRRGVNREAERVMREAREVGLAPALRVDATRGFLLQSQLGRDAIVDVAHQVLADHVTESVEVAPAGDATIDAPPWSGAELIYVLPLPGVMDPVAQSTESALRRRGLDVAAARTYRRYWLGDATQQTTEQIGNRLLFNGSIEQLVHGSLSFERLDVGIGYAFERKEIPLRDMQRESQLMQLSREGQLYLTLAEMKTIRQHFRELGRDPTDVELETIAQTWSEHCSHKTLAGRIRYEDEHGARQFDNMLKETIFAATQKIRRRWGDNDWCLSVFKDNAGVVEFDGDQCLTFKVETHNHPSALEPYGGANTGLGGVIRDTLGTGLGAKPVASTDVFCFAPPNMQLADLPAGVLHPRRIMQGVVAGVRDYGNRMGIPTVNGAVFFDKRYLGNPLVYCGSVGIIPRDAIEKCPQTGDWIVSLGGRTGRDGIHGATFSSAELTSESETISGGAVQIGNAITEKMLMDVLLVARDRQLFHAVTDCGAGGFSSAVGEMGETLGAEVWLEKAPLKYDGLSYTEIWISEAQERMVLAVPPSAWEELHSLCAAEGVEATIIGQFTDTHRLILTYHGHQVADLSMEFLHGGRPPVIRQATYQPTATQPLSPPTPTGASAGEPDHEACLLDLLACWNIASKHWIVRQYDHEVQGGSVVKPFVGHDGPSDAAVVRPLHHSPRGFVLACGMNPMLGDIDPYHMATNAIDEAVRNCVAVGADPKRIAILDNFCWGNTDDAATLGSLVRAALGCHDLALALETPFISGKDSLNNEFTYEDATGKRHSISIPASLLISALGQIADVTKCVTMDAKAPGNRLYLVGTTHATMGGSHWAQVTGRTGGAVPTVDHHLAPKIFEQVHQAIDRRLVRSCHDVSEGGLAVAAAEMAFAGRIGIDLSVAPIIAESLGQTSGDAIDPVSAALYSESPTRFLCEVAPERVEEWEKVMNAIPHCHVGMTATHGSLRVSRPNSAHVLDVAIDRLQQAWWRPLDLDHTSH